jgi:hypothetical protein
MTETFRQNRKVLTLKSWQVVVSLWFIEDESHKRCCQFTGSLSIVFVASIEVKTIVFPALVHFFHRLICMQSIAKLS